MSGGGLVSIDTTSFQVVSTARFNATSYSVCDVNIGGATCFAADIRVVTNVNGDTSIYAARIPDTNANKEVRPVLSFRLLLVVFSNRPIEQVIQVGYNNGYLSTKSVTYLDWGAIVQSDLLDGRLAYYWGDRRSSAGCGIKRWDGKSRDMTPLSLFTFKDASISNFDKCTPKHSAFGFQFEF